MNKDLPQALQELFKEVEKNKGGSHMASPLSYTAPLIGVSANLTDGQGSCIARAYTDSVIKAGGIPMLIPVTTDTVVLANALRRVDGLILSGGDDINPVYIDEDPAPGLGNVSPERDIYDLKLIKLATDMNIPILGICRGHQLLGVAYGCGLYQDLYTQHKHEFAIDHSPKIPKTEPCHGIELIQDDSLLHKLLFGDKQKIRVNSIHHQALRQVQPPFIETAIAADEINEAMEALPEKNILSVQWHPEQLVAGGDELQLKLFEYLIAEARLYRRARTFHKHHMILDSHVDTPMKFKEGFDIGTYTEALVDLPKMETGDVDTCFMVAYLPQGDLTSQDHDKAVKYAVGKLAMLREQVERHPERASIVTTPEEILRAKKSGVKAIVPGIENGYAIGEDLSMLREYKEMGVAYITLCHNGDNLIADSARKSEGRNNGLSDFGKDVVREMNRLGLMIDVAHAGPKTIEDVLAVSSMPIVSSHSSCRALCDHPRNLTDEQIKAIAAHGGVVQICLYAGFINQEEEKASILDAVDHIEHIIRLVGADHVGIGSDFDGDGELIGCRNSQDLIRLTIELLRRGYEENTLSRIWGGNFLRVMEHCQKQEYTC
ncbi:membrane dipeptidase [Porphyromonas pogonae]|uniref:membrane dipeptidase n=1 Tax=Porphyromonas pogonae TaxID=867595 RepID=UPI002E7A1496|nr:membrane dipeptidase [Porphyromonas pogonae]